MKFVSRTQRSFRTCFFVDLLNWKQTVDNFCFCMGMTITLAFSSVHWLLFFWWILRYSYTAWRREVLLFSYFFFRPVKLARFNLSFQFTIWIDMTLVCVAHGLFLSYIIVENFFATSHWVMRSNNCLFMFPNVSDFTTGIFTSSVSLFIFYYRNIYKFR